MSILAHIALGSNLGDRKQNLDLAVASLRAEPGITIQHITPYQGTEPVGGPIGQGAFLNAAAALLTTLDPFDLLQALHRVEKEAGRVRSVRWGERVLDLDLLLYGDRIIETEPVRNRVYGGVTPGLTVPHPRMAVRRFVLDPLAVIAPDVVDPLTGRTITELQANLRRRPRYFAIHDPLRQFDGHFATALARNLRAAEIQEQTYSKPGGEELPTAESPESHNRFEEGATRHRRRLRRQFLTLNRSLWTPEYVEDRWLVSQFWFDANFLDSSIAEVNFATIQERILTKRSEVIEPIFVVTPPGYRRGLARGSPVWRGHAILGSTPILEVSKDDVGQAFGDVLAACQATRG